MKLIDDLEDQIKDYMSGDYEIIDINSIPSVEDVTFKKKVLKINLCSYSIDIRKSSNLLIKHRKKTSGKIHKAFLTTTSKIAKYYGGEIRSFQGDSILVFWPATVQDLNKAVKSAMVTTWLLGVKFSKYFKKYSELDFGIGIDWSEVYILRAGIARDANNNDLVFIGRCVNFAVAIANEAKGPNHIGISKDVYHNLEDSLKYQYRKASYSDRIWKNIYERNGEFYVAENMWKEGTVDWNDETHRCKVSSYYIVL